MIASCHHTTTCQVNLVATGMKVWDSRYFASWSRNKMRVPRSSLRASLASPLHLGMPIRVDPSILQPRFKQHSMLVRSLGRQSLFLLVAIE